MAADALAALANLDLLPGRGRLEDLDVLRDEVDKVSAAGLFAGGLGDGNDLAAARLGMGLIDVGLPAWELRLEVVPPNGDVFLAGPLLANLGGEVDLEGRTHADVILALDADTLELLEGPVPEEVRKGVETLGGQDAVGDDPSVVFEEDAGGLFVDLLADGQEAGLLNRESRPPMKVSNVSRDRLA